MSTMQALINLKRVLTNAGAIEIEKLITNLYTKGALNRGQIRELGHALVELSKELPDDAKVLH